MDVEEVKLTTTDLRERITLKVKLPRMFYLRMILTIALIKLASIVAWCSIEIELLEEKKSED